MKPIKQIVQDIKRICISKGITIACAESITGGLLSYTFIKYPQASDYLKGSIVAYNDEIKASLLGINPELIKTHTAVSKEVAISMAKAAKAKFNANIGLSTTGYAGPDKDRKKTGTVFIAIATDKNNIVKRLKFSGTRMQIQQRTVETLLRILHRQLKDRK